MAPTESTACRELLIPVAVSGLSYNCDELEKALAQLVVRLQPAMRPPSPAAIPSDECKSPPDGSQPSLCVQLRGLSERITGCIVNISGALDRLEL